jgi:Fe-S-cluster containining protein
MIDTFYLHLEFKNKKSNWSIKLPFLCIKCGLCCKLEDFLTAGEISAKPEEQPQVHSKIQALFQELGKIWEADQAKYDDYIGYTLCPFLVAKTCSIYEVRPEGCRLFPNTAFGMKTQDCEALTRLKKQRGALKKRRTAKETCGFTSASKSDETINASKFTEKQYQTCINKLRQAGITDNELNLFNYFNGK